MKNLKIKTLSKEWADRDTILLHAAFQVLVDFIDKERPGKIIDWNHDQQHRKLWKEMTGLYRWWTKERPKRSSPLDNRNLKKPPQRIWNLQKGESFNLKNQLREYPEYYKALEKYSKLEEKWVQEDQKNLQRLIEVRSHLWT